MICAQVVDSGVSEGSCFFRHSESSASVEHGYLKEADGSLGSSDLQYDLTRRKVVQCESENLSCQNAFSMIRGTP